MATAAVATVSGSPANSCWRFSFVERRPSLTARGSFSLDRRPSAPECRVSYKSDDKLRRRNSWRWSWKNVLTRPFQSHSATRGGSFREKDKNGKKNSPGSAKNVPKDPVEARMQMAKLLRMWYTDADSSDDSSDDEGESSCEGRKRPCGPRVLGNELSSSGEEDEKWMEQEGRCDGQVSLYVSEGPSSSMDTESKGSAQRIPESADQDPAGESSEGESSETNSNSGRRAYEQPAVPVNSNPNVLTSVQDTFNHDGVISPMQICDLERFVDIKKQIEHSCSSSCERCDEGQSCVDVDDERCVDDGGEKFTSEGEFQEGGGTRCAAWMLARSGGGGFFGESVVKPPLGGHRRSSLLSPREACLEGSMESAHNDGLSASAAMQNAEQSEIRREELIKGSLDEDIESVGMQLGKGKGEERVRVAGEMEDLFSSQDLNAIRRFLGMSLQQINANKVLENGRAKHPEPTAVVSLGNLMECGHQQQLAHGRSFPHMEVLPDYPSTYNKNRESAFTKEQKDESCGLHCEFKGFGCPFPDTRWVLEMEKHMKSNVGEHLRLVSQAANEQKEQLKNQRLLQEKQGTLIRELTGTVHNLKDIVEDQMKKNESQEKLILSLKDQLREQRKQNQRFERETSRQFQALDQSTPSTLTSLPTSPSAAEMLWPIKNFSKRVRRVREGEFDDPLISEPFYTGASGYKLSIWLYLNGRGKNLGSCVSVYARVMPGEHDTILNWPVRPTYTFTLFDQSEGEKDNVVRTRKVNDIKRVGGKHHGIDRPGGGDRSVIVGFDDFITHEQLERSNYLVDDCLYLKLEAQLFS